MSEVWKILLVFLLLYLLFGRFVYPALLPVSWRPRHRGGKFKQATTLQTKTPPQMMQLPPTFDWRHKLQFEVPSQGACGACWALVPTIALQKRFELLGQSIPPLSAQYLLDCEQYCSDISNVESCDEGCTGGLLDHSWQFLKENGVPSESVLPYRGYTQQCRQLPENTRMYRAAEIYKVPSNVGAIKSEIASNGPVTAGMEAFSCFANFRGKGHYAKERGTSAIGAHAVVLIGWDQQGWVGVNVWDKSWGDDGYFRIKYGECGIENGVVAGTPLTR